MVRDIPNAITKADSLISYAYTDKTEAPPSKSPKQETTEKTALQIFHCPTRNDQNLLSSLSDHQFTLEESEHQEKILQFNPPFFPVLQAPPSPRTLSSHREKALLNKLRNSTKNVLPKEKYDLLKEAIEIDSKVALQSLLKKTQFPLNASTLPNKQTLLHLACQGGHTTIINLLASQNVTLSLKTRDVFGMTPLDYMCNTNNFRALIECATFYISNHQSPEITDETKKRNEPSLLLLKFFLLSLDSSSTTTSWVLERLFCTTNKKIKSIYRKFSTKPIQVIPYEIHKTDNVIETLSVKTLKLRDTQYAAISEGESTPVLLAIPQCEEPKLNIQTILLKLSAPKYLKQISPNRTNVLDEFMEALFEPKKWEEYCQKFTEDNLLKLGSFFHVLPEHCLAHLFERGVNADHPQLAQKALEGIQSKSSKNFSVQNLLRVLTTLSNKSPELLHFSENSDFLAGYGSNLAGIIVLSPPHEQYELLKFFLNVFRNDANWKDKRSILFDSFTDAFLSNKSLTLVLYILFLKFTPANLLKPLLNRLPTSLLAQFCIKHESIEKLFEEVLSRLENLTERVVQADRDLAVFYQKHPKVIETTTQILSGNRKINLGASFLHTSNVLENEWSEEIFANNLGHIIGHLNNSSVPRTELKTAKFDSNILSEAIPHFENLKQKFSPLILSKYKQLLESEKYKDVNDYLALVIDLINNKRSLSSVLNHTELGNSEATVEQIIAGSTKRLTPYKNFLQNLQTALTTNNAFRAFIIKIILEKELAKNILHLLYVENLFNELLATSLLTHLSNLNQLDHKHIELARLVTHFSILLNSPELRNSIIALCTKLPLESCTDKMKAYCTT